MIVGWLQHLKMVICQNLLFVIIIKLMSLFPVLRRKKQVKFSNPLSGRYYDNTKYQNSFSFTSDDEASWQEGTAMKSQSVVCYQLKKQLPKSNYFGSNAELKSGTLVKPSKILNLLQTMSNPYSNTYSKRCFKDHNPNLQSSNPQPPSENAKKVKVEKSGFKGKPTKFQQIQIKLLQLLPERRGMITEQNEQKKFKVNLERYFSLFFKKKASGEVFEELSNFVQKYIDDVLVDEENYDQKQSNEQKFHITSKSSLYQKLRQLQRLGNLQQIKELLKQYCVPRYESRQIFLRDLLSLATNLVNQQYQLHNDHPYCLLTQQGQRITDFAQIKFSTKQLFMAQQNQVQQLFQQYFRQRQRQQSRQHKGFFRQTLKNHFRHQLAAHGLYEQSSVPDKSFIEQRAQKRNNLFRAQNIINLKYSKHSERRKRFQQSLEIQKSPRKQTMIQLKKSTKLNTQHQNYITIEQRIVDEFKLLKTINDCQDFVFRNDENNRNKVQFGIIVKESPYFKSKNQQQVHKIFSALSFTEVNDSSSYLKQPVTLEQYIQLRKIIACLADQQSIINFIDRYLSFDDYGELQKQGLHQILAFVIGGTKSTSEVIVLTVWRWLQKNGVIVNDILRRSNMRLMYQRNKLVYYFLISLIFGTNETTALDLAEQILV